MGSKDDKTVIGKGKIVSNLVNDNTQEQSKNFLK